MTIPIVMHEVHSYLFGIRTYHYSQTYYSLIYFCQRTSYLAVVYFTLTGKTKNARTHAESFLRYSFFCFLDTSSDAVQILFTFCGSPKKSQKLLFYHRVFPFLCKLTIVYIKFIYDEPSGRKRKKRQSSKVLSCQILCFF